MKQLFIVLKNNNGDVLSKKYKHAIHTTIGNKSAPFNNIEPTTVSDTFGRVIEDMILNFVKDMQKQNNLSFKTIATIY